MLQSDRVTISSDLYPPASQLVRPAVHPILEHSLLAPIASQRAITPALQSMSTGAGFVYFALNVSEESFGVTVSALPQRASTIHLHQEVQVRLEAFRASYGVSAR